MFRYFIEHISEFESSGSFPEFKVRIILPQDLEVRGISAQVTPDQKIVFLPVNGQLVDHIIGIFNIIFELTDGELVVKPEFALLEYCNV